MPLYTNPAELEKIKAACVAAAEVLRGTCEFVREGLTTLEIDLRAAELMKQFGCRSGCLGYRSSKRSTPPYPGYTCISVNDEIVHGVPSKERIVRSGDIVSIDIVVEKDGYYGDNTRTVAVGAIDPRTEKLLRATEESLYLGIEQARTGNRIGDISHAVQSHVEANGFSVVREFVGHGVGRTMHEDPQIENFGRAGTGPELKAGMVLAIEPMINRGGHKLKIDADGWTARTLDGEPSAHFEHTIVITKNGPKILTKVM